MDKSELLEYLKNNSIKFVSPVKTADLVSFKVGGSGKIAVFPKTITQLTDVIEFIKQEKYVILGNGSNCYFTDDFFDGIIIVTSRLNKIEVENNTIIANCGANINSLCRFAMENNLSGLEFAYGIPGTVGGGVYMNASAFGGCFSDVVLSSTVLHIDSGAIFELDSEKHCFNIKKSIFQKKKLCLLATKFKLNYSNANEILEKMNAYRQKRKETQPLNMPSAGSTFVKPEKNHASFLIDKAGLKGFSVGEAQISEKHAGFIVNRGKATAKDVKELIKYIKSVVFEKFYVDLKEEIIYLE